MISKVICEVVSELTSEIELPSFSIHLSYLIIMISKTEGSTLIMQYFIHLLLQFSRDSAISEIRDDVVKKLIGTFARHAVILLR